MSDLPINHKTAVNILRYILYNGNVSISEIVESCSVGTLSASKTVRFFLDNGLLAQGLQKENVRSGMRPERYRINPKYNFITYSLSATRFRAKLINADGKIIDSKIYSDQDHILCEKDFEAFIRDFAEKCCYREEYRFGCAVIFSAQSFFGMDITEQNTLSDVKAKLENTVRSVTGIRRVAICTREELAGEYFTKTQKYADKTVVYLCLNYDRLYSAATVCGQKVTGANGRGFCASEMMIDHIRSAHFIMKERKTPDELADLVAIICANARAFYDPHFICLDTEDYKYLSGLAGIANTFLRDKYDLPDGAPLTVDTTSRKGLSVVDLGAATVLKGLLVDDIEKSLGKIEKEP